MVSFKANLIYFSGRNTDRIYNVQIEASTNLEYFQVFRGGKV